MYLVLFYFIHGIYWSLKYIIYLLVNDLFSAHKLLGFKGSVSLAHDCVLSTTTIFRTQ